jgi:hypothetical protein
MDGSSLLEGKELIAVSLGTEKGSHLVKQATEAWFCRLFAFSRVLVSVSH